MTSKSKGEWALVRVGQLAKQVWRREEVVADSRYRMLGVRWYANGVFVREELPGSAIGAQYVYRVRAGDFIYNRLFAFKGSFGVVTQEHDGCFVSNEFPLFQVDRSCADAEFLLLLFSQPRMWARVDALSSGTTSISRNRFKEEDFLSLQIKLPEVAEQRAITELIGLADETVQGTTSLIGYLEVAKRSAMTQLLSQAIPRTSSPLRKTRIGLLPNDWEVTSLGSVLKDIGGGFSPKCPSRPAGLNEWGVLKVSAVTSGVFLPNENKVLPPGLTPEPAIEVKAGDLLITRSNTVELVGMTCYVEETRPRLVLCDKFLRLEVDDKRACPRFLNQCLKVGRVRRAIEHGATGSSGSMKNVSQSRPRDVLIPLPPLDIQRRIAAAGEEFDRRIAAGRVYLDQLQETKRGLAQALLSGRVRVPPRALRREEA
jgi:type I restriction enzyme S subunit